ncbi:hypothetical protein K502DRAFT_345660 [Neoconidiobolus thromboides FSU 785]|nr:hypothetical protein K502DRAFT_345660 [Neoconidiobolus thromboides FSU 785]
MAASLVKDYGAVTAIIYHPLNQRGRENGVRDSSHIKDIIKAFFNITSSFNHLNLKDSKITIDNYSTGALLNALLALDINQYTNNSKFVNQVKNVVSIGDIFILVWNH